MNLWRTLGILGFVTSLVATPLCRADDADALKSKELDKNGQTYVLPVEKELADAMKDLRKLKLKIESQSKQRKELEAQLRVAKNAMSTWEHQHRLLLEEAANLNDNGQKNDRILKANILFDKLKEANEFRENLEKQLGGLGAEDKTQFVNQVIDLGVKVDKAQDQYKELAADPDVKQALEKLNQPGKPKMRLGPTEQFATNLNMLKKWRNDVASSVIPVKHDSNVPVVEVTLNGSIVREMILDSGASVVMITADLAKQLNLNPTDKDQTVHFKLGDGREFDAKAMTLKSVRVGQFTVTDVECAVLPATLVAAEPAIGGSFLNNFVYKIDASAHELHLAIIAGNPKVTSGEKKTTAKSAGGN